MKSLLFTLLGIVAFFSPSLAYDCKTEKMTQLCLSPAVDQCYNCVKNVVLHDDVIDHTLSVCVTVFHNQLGALENYPSKVWNCTMFRHDHSEDDEHSHPIDPVIIGNGEDESYIVDKVEDKIDDEIEDEVDDEIDRIDDIVDMIFDSLNHNIQVENIEESEEMSNHFEVKKYESPWGPLSECNQWFYKEICTNKVAKFCFDCRKFIGKELFTRVSRYHYYCSPFYKDMNEKETVDWLSKEKYECKIWNNPNYKPSMAVESVSSEGLYPACSGPICSKQGWQFQKSDFGKDWCGLGKCKAYGKKYYCSSPTVCGKKTNEHEFETLGCGSEKFKCMLKKSCRNLVKQLENCGQDMICAYSIISGTDNESFFNLVKCTFPN
jgi:hypothetical protein